MKRFVIYSTLLFFFLVGCNKSKEEDDLVHLERISREETEGLMEFLEILGENGYSTEEYISVKSEMLGTQHNILINGENLVIFEYDSKEYALMDVNNISQDGYSYTKYSADGVATVKNFSWEIEPRYYTYKNLIIRYVGVNKELSQTLYTISGERLFQ